MLDILTIGDSTIDTFLILDKKTPGCTHITKQNLLCFDYAQKIHIQDSTQAIGGNAANVAVGTQTLGLNTAIVTRLGNDINGHAIKKELERRGINTNFIKIVPGENTNYAVVLNYKTERTVLSYHSKKKYSLPHNLPNSKVIYYTSHGRGFYKLQRQLIKAIRKNQTTVCFNPGSYQLQQGLDISRQFLPFVDVLIVNKTEAQTLVEKKSDNMYRIAREIYKQGVSVVVITDSTNGSYSYDGDALYYMPIFPINAIARTGAGDAFTSGFISAIAHGKQVYHALIWGTANAGGVITEFGAQEGLLNRHNLNKMIKKYPKLKPMII